MTWRGERTDGPSRRPSGYCGKPSGRPYRRTSWNRRTLVSPSEPPLQITWQTALPSASQRAAWSLLWTRLLGREVGGEASPARDPAPYRAEAALCFREQV